MSGTRFVDAYGEGRTPGLRRAEDAFGLAKRRLPHAVFHFIEGGSRCSVPDLATRQAFDAIKLRPRVGEATKDRSQGCIVCGEVHNAPFGIAPLAMGGLVDPRANDAIARLSSFGKIPACASTYSTGSLERMLEASDGRAWFQLYGQADMAATDAIVDRASAAGYRTLIVTLDRPQEGSWEQALRKDAMRVVRPSIRNGAAFLRNPVWAYRQMRAGPQYPANLSDMAQSKDAAVASSPFGWRDVARLRERWQGRLIVKGIMDVMDARKAKDLGIDGIYVSNHAGRHFSSGPSAIDVLWDMRSEVGPTIELFLDGGVRTGEDIVKALALGADMVFIGRPVLYALGADGPRGLATLLDVISDELDVALSQVGVSAAAEIRRTVLLNQPPPRLGKATLRLVESNDAG